MKRRNFLLKGTAIGGAAMVAPTSFSFAESVENKGVAPFKMKYAPHFGMFKNSAGEDFEDQIQFMYDQGFRALEDNSMKGRSVDDQSRIAKKMEKLGMEMGVFVAHKIYWNEPSLTSGDKGKREEFLKDVKGSVEVAKRVNAKWMTVVPGYLDLKKDMGYQTVNVIDSLKYACEILEPHGLVMVLEPLNFRDHPGLFLTKAAQGFEVCKAVGSDSCKILFDIYHQQITEGNLIPNIDLSYDEIGYVQIGDNPGRKEPTTGEINYKNVFKHLHEKGFKGILGMEHGNFNSGKEGEEAVIKAYRTVDDF